MRGRLLVTVSVIALVSVACTGSSAPSSDPERTTIPSETLLLGTGAGPLLVSVPEGSVLFEGSGSVASLGGAWVLSASDASGSTILQSRDGATGGIVGTTLVPGELGVRVVSESGRAVALMEPLPPGWDPLVPIPRSRTTIVVADPAGEGEPKTFDLRGNFEPEAFSSDDNQLFLIQHLPAETPTAYRVTVLDLDRGRVLPVFGPFKGAAERMPGIRLQQVLSPSGGQLYTLYSSASPGYVPHGAPGPADAIVSFVHVLSLRDGWAHCVGLPEEMWDRPSSEQAMAPSPDGRYLFIVDAGLGTIAVMHIGSLRVRTGEVDLDLSGRIERTTAQMSADGRTMFVANAGRDGSTISAIHMGTFEVGDRWRLDGMVTSLGMSMDGARLYAAIGDQLVVLDASTGREVATVPIAAPDTVTRVLALAA